MQKNQLKEIIALDTVKSSDFTDELPASEQLALRWVLERAKTKYTQSHSFNRACNSSPCAELRFGPPGRELAWSEDPY
ncbi:MAG: hypothetical protein ABIL58_28320 [Pseudomonadota bacterium]